MTKINHKTTTQRPRLLLRHFALVLSISLTACGGDSAKSTETLPTTPETVYPDYALALLLGGNATAENASDSGHGFSTPIPTLTEEELTRHLIGDTHFETSFTTLNSMV